MRILLIGDFPPPPGGIAIHVQQLHQSLRSNGVETTVLDIGKGGRPAPDVLPIRTGSQFARQLARFAMAGWLPHLHTSGDNPKSWLVAAAVASVARLARGPAVITLHSGLLPGFLAASPARRLMARVTLAGYGRVIAVSEAVGGAVTGCGVPASRIRIHPAFCASQVTAGPAPAGLDEARARRSPLLAMAHHPSPVYGRTVMLRALAHLAERHPRVGLALFGPGTGGAELEAEARAAGVADRIERFGELEHASALGLIARCDAFVRPTTADGDSISVREALALGIPCVASDVCVRPAGAMTFRAGDPLDLVARIDEALARGPARVPGPDAGPVLLAIYRSLHQPLGRRAPSAA